MNKKMNSFGKALLKYVIIYICVAAVGLIVFYRFMAEYERSRPTSAMNAYLETFDDEKINSMTKDACAAFDEKLQEPSFIRDYFQSAVASGLNCRKLSSQSTESEPVYEIRSADNVIGRVKLAQNENASFGFRSYYPEEESFFIDEALCESFEVTVPNEYSVYCADKLLEKDYISADDVEYEELEPFYSGGLPITHLVKYTVGPLYGDYELTVKNAAGEPVKAENYGLLPENCTPDEQKNIEEFGNDFLKAWLNYSSSPKESLRPRYRIVTRMVVPESGLATRIEDSLFAMTYSANKQDILQNIVFNKTSKIGEGYYLVDMSYDVNTLGNNGWVASSGNMKVIVTDSSGKYLAAAMTNY